MHDLKHIKNLLLGLGCLLLSGCTTLDGPPNPDDPYESFNRSMFTFNETLDKYALKPVAQGYNFVMPDIASKGVSNFFSNVNDIVVLFNQLLQFKFHDAISTSARLVFNTTFGLLGLIDVASEMDLPKYNEDFGQTLAYWGVGSGSYLVLPIIGPTTFRDTAGIAVDVSYFDPVFHRQTLHQSLVTFGIKYIDIRAGLLKATNILDETVPDKYAFMRDAYLSRREFLIYDGNPPDDFSEDELFDDEELFDDAEPSDENNTGDETMNDGISDEILHEESLKTRTEIMLLKAPATDKP